MKFSQMLVYAFCIKAMPKIKLNLALCKYAEPQLT
jgi:hypothetical protein